MSRTRCAFDATTTLSRVFRPQTLERANLAAFPLTRLLTPRLYSKTQSRTYSRSPASINGQGNENRPQRTSFQLKDGRWPRDKEIEIAFPLVHMKEQDGISEPVPARVILSQIDLRADSLILLSLPKPDGPHYPLCQVVDRKEQAQFERAKVKQVRKKAVQMKELELNWSIDPHDLGHRLKTATEFLKKGYKIEVRLVSKRHKRQASRDEANEVLRKVRELVNDVPGSKEARATEGQVGRSMKVYLEGPPGGAVQEATS